MGLTVRARANARPEPLRDSQAFFELVDAVAHGEESLVWLADAAEGVEEGVGDVLEDAGLVVCAAGWMGDVLVHDYLLHMKCHQRSNLMWHERSYPFRGLEESPEKTSPLQKWMPTKAL